jgi:hypothetical protein
MAEWSCSQCTYLNSSCNGATACELCGNDRDCLTDKQQWSCALCTSPQPPESNQCDTCGSRRQPQLNTAERVITDDKPNPKTSPLQLLTQAASGVPDEDLYILDACSCRMRRDDLLQLLTSAITKHILPSNTSLHAAVAALSCPRCSCLLSNQDAYRLLGGPGLGQVYTCLCAKMSHLLPKPLNKPSSPPICPSCSTNMTPTASLKTSTCPNKQTLKQALKSRGLQQPPGPKEHSATALAAALSATATWCCLTCPAVVDPAAAVQAALHAASVTAANASSTVSSSSSGATPAAVAAVKAACSSSASIWLAVEQLLGVMKGDLEAVAGKVGPAGKSTKGGGGKGGSTASKRRWSHKGPGSSSKWAAGTGASRTSE